MTNQFLIDLGINEIPGVYGFYRDEDGTIQARNISDELKISSVLAKSIHEQADEFGIPEDENTFNRLARVLEKLKEQKETPKTFINALKALDVKNAGVYAIDFDQQSIKLLMYWNQYTSSFSQMCGEGEGFYFRFQQTLGTCTRLKKQRLDTLEDIRRYLGSILLIADSLGDDIPHKQKNARLGGLISIIDKALKSVQDDYRDYAYNFYRDFPNLFGSSHLVKPYLQRIRDLERENAKLKGEPPPEEEFFDSDF